MQLYHDSRSLNCRAPRGSVPCRTPVRLRLYGADGVRKATVQVISDGKASELVMTRQADGGYEATYQTPEKPVLCWYYFSVFMSDGRTVYYGNAEDGLGGVGETSDHVPPAFQITVYDPAYQTPAFMRDGVMYQIFPDRYARSKMPESKRTDIYIHENWDDRPKVRVESIPGDNYSLDFFGGDLKGIQAHLAELADLGVTVIYLNPIFRARSNHRYDTSDYSVIDPMLGATADFAVLCQEARKYGIRILLDGVFSHTGDDSIYFNRYGRQPSIGACQSKSSPFYPWYKFRHYPDDYACWWGFKSLPELNKENEDYRAYMFRENGIVRKWLRTGASGWRLDVADELPMRFLRDLRTAARREKHDAVILGEVWEDASHKVAYGETRCYCLGDTLDSVMNYPLRNACISFLLERTDAEALCRVIQSQRENYAPPFYYSLMNLMGSHDRARIVSILGGSVSRDDARGDENEPKLTAEQYALGKQRMLKFLTILVCLPGIPCIYYGDEVGLQGAADPYCRGTYPWGHEDLALREQVKEILALRKRQVLRTGSLSVRSDGADAIVIRREIRGEQDVFGNEAKSDAFEIRISRK